MLKETNDELDLQNFTENVSFLAGCFDNSFTLQSSLNYVKDYVATTKNEHVSKERVCLVKKKNNLTQSKQVDTSVFNIDNIKTQGSEKSVFNKKLRNWGLPLEIASKYEQKGIVEMFDWQVKCLSNSKVLTECQNLVYSAPTSAGKTLVAEILTIKTVLERQKKVIIILPFVSIVREKMFYLQDILSSSGVRVEGFMGSQSPPGGLQAVHIAICTIEKANSLINKLLDENNISELGAVIVDELHLLGDPHRGYILELLLTKIKYVCSNNDSVKIQIVGMSATLPNLEMLANWLEAELFVTEFRPIPLDEYCLVGNKYYDKNGKCIGSFNNSINIEGDYVLSLCLETIKEGCSILIFCMTKNRCENLAQSISSSFFKMGCLNNEQGKILREQLNSHSILEVLEQLKNCPVGLDEILKNIISFGVAYHHAGLTFDERDIIEGAFKSGAIRVLVATSTLSSGVNLPARKVIIRCPVFQRQPINILTYKQMIGRAGRMGKDVKGESILLCTAAEQKIGFDLMMGNLDPVKSCIESEDKFMRATLEMIASQEICTKTELDFYTKCTLLFVQSDVPSQKFLLEDTLKKLINFELVRIQDDGNEKKYVATSLGKACLSSSMAPNDGLSLFCELQKARQCLVLETDLHLIYLVTPYSVSNQWNNIDWLHLLNLWESLTAAMKRVGELVGVQESFIIRCLRGTNNMNNNQNKLNIHKRFYTALALQDLVNEVPLSEVACKFQCARGFLQGLQQSSATFAGMVTAFCHQLGWKNMELIISQFQDRLQFGIHSELLELMKLTSLNGVRARTLFDAGFETIASIASAEVNLIENVLHKSVPFQSEKEREDDDCADVRKRNKIRNIWITGCCGLTAKEAAENLILEARRYLAQEIGVTEIKWKDTKLSDHSTCNGSNSEAIAKCNDFESIGEEINQNGNHSENCNISNEVTKQSDIKEMKSKVKDTIFININEKCEDIKSQNLSKKLLIQPCDIVANKKRETFFKKNISIDNDENKTIKPIKDTTSKTPLSIEKEDIVWESLSFTEAGLDNISKCRTSDKIFSPNISFGDTSDNLDSNDKNITPLKPISSKDVSLFSSEGDNSSVFDDSLPVDLIPNSLIDHGKIVPESKNSNNIENTTNFLDMNSKTILNVFKSTLFEIDEDEDIKLVYEDEKINLENNRLNENVSQENEIVNTQEFEITCLKKSFISPLKRQAHFGEDYSPTLPKKLKRLPKKHNISKIIINSPKSEQFIMKFGENTVNCHVLREHDIIKNFTCIEKLKELSILLDTNSKSIKASEAIGSHIIKKIMGPPEITPIKEDLPIRGIAFCINRKLCLYLDLTTLGKLITTFKFMLSNFICNPLVKMAMFSSKSNYNHIRKWLGKDISSACIDITLYEWLLDSDEKISKIIDLAKKYSGVDLLNIKINVDEQKRTYNSLNANELFCIKAWCVLSIAEEQNKLLEKYPFMKNCLDTEAHVSKILANCEFHGIAVDKDLASKLLIDVKNSQEILQKKAYKLCGYHFNFNSSKDVAKALGLYKGRKISTKKSVLSAHNSPMASIVIYWRKLNSILTKTLYPLTEQAYIYSADNRISPLYTMYTCTGRISMHEPNLQNVPRTFSIPLKYLSTKDTELSEDVIEFNCRNVFKAAPGYVFVSADYCQLEMRILTHYSKDTVLTKIMSTNIDVFKSIAASWGGVPEDNVDDDLRQKAKQLCYGILYGMGNRTLAQLLDVNEIEAAMFMDTFYKTYPAIKGFTQNVIEECKKNGYVETLMKRRRYLPDINSNIISKRSAAERQAVSTTIQGSAADIAKAAMCAIDKITNLDVDKPRLILQMHDELVYEVKESQKSNFIKVLRKLMQETVRLNVPLPVKLKNGYTWGTMEEVKF
ncbi:unnamed protein product, partial [Brenthis ino]